MLSACFDAIYNSNYFIVFVGDNYGSCVPHVIIDELERQHHFIKKGSNKSITKLEIDCAVSNNSLSMDNIFSFLGMKTILIKTIENEMHYDGKDKVPSDYEICNCALRTTFFKRGLVDPYKRLIVNVWTYPPFHLINSFMKSNKSDQLELLALVLFDLLAYDGINLLRSYLNQAFSFLRKRSYDKEEPLNSIRFIVKYIFPKISESMLKSYRVCPDF